MLELTAGQEEGGSPRSQPEAQTHPQAVSELVPQRTLLALALGLN